MGFHRTARNAASRLKRAMRFTTRLPIHTGPSGNTEAMPSPRPTDAMRVSGGRTCGVTR